MALVFVFLLGLIFGSFANAWIYRLPRECLSPLKGRSFCPSCFHPIRAVDNIPLVSYLFLKGKCRFCQHPISLLYPFIEFLMGSLFVLAYWMVTQGASSFYDFQSAGEARAALLVLWYLLFVLVVSSFIDAKYRILPDEMTLPGMFLAPLCSLVVGLYPMAFLFHSPLFSHPLLARFLYSLLGMVVGGGLIYAIGVFGELIFRKEAMGFGDVKFMAMFGGYLGWQSILAAFFLACFAGSLFGAVYYFLTKDHYIPFGPFLALGVFIMLFFSKPFFILLHLYYPFL